MPAADAGPVLGFRDGFDAGFEIIRSAPGESGGWELAARVPPDSPLFLGHFPGRPIVPGVALLALVARAARDWRGEAGGLLGVHGWKLRHPVGPGEAIALRLTASDSKRDSNRDSKDWTPASGPPDGAGEEITFELRRTEGEREAVTTGRVRVGSSRQSAQ